MSSNPLRPPTVPETSQALAATAPERTPWPDLFDNPELVEEEWGDHLATRAPSDRRRLITALAFARAAHGDQTRRGGLAPYWVHPVRVSLGLAEWGHLDPDVLAAALLHDTVEDTDTTIGSIRAAFGPRVAELVAWLTAPPSERDAELMAYYGRLYREAPDTVVVMKLADRVDNIRSIQALVMRTGPRYQRWAAGYLGRTRRLILPLAGRAPSVSRVALVASMADLAGFVASDFTDG